VLPIRLDYFDDQDYRVPESVPFITMNPRAKIAENAQLETRLSPFEQITQLESEQEGRVLQAMEKINADEHEAEKSLIAMRKQEADKLAAESEKELQNYEATEPAAILAKGKEDTAADLKAITKQFEKTEDKAVAALLDSMLDLSFLKS
jgi:alanyl-tRNA synthetase